MPQQKNCTYTFFCLLHVNAKHWLVVQCPKELVPTSKKTCYNYSFGLYYLYFTLHNYVNSIEKMKSLREVLTSKYCNY